jgi:hypothetical protein
MKVISPHKLNAFTFQRLIVGVLDMIRYPSAEYTPQ